MPQIYSRTPLEQPTPRRRRSATYSSSSSSSSSANDITSATLPDLLTDADESIVLADLVRTGEASRLRRRGAMRFDHSHSRGASGSGLDSVHAPVIPGAPIPPNTDLILVERSNWDSDSDQDISLFAGHSLSRFARRRHTRPSRRYGPYGSASTSAAAGMVAQPEGKDEYVYTLVCGAEVTDCDSEEVEAFKPSILPLYPPPSPRLKGKGLKRNTGCGATVHVRAAPIPRFSMWAARSASSETVVPLDACYFDTKEAARFVRSSCGCVKEGIGCAVCGNALGTLYTPCKSASEGLFCTRQSDKLPTSSIHPNVYATSAGLPTSSRTGKSKQHIYTFFADAVTSTPGYTFPPPKPSRSRSSLTREDFTVSPETSPRFASLLPLPPAPYIYARDDDYDDEEMESYPPYHSNELSRWSELDPIYGSGWRPIMGPGFDLTAQSPTSPAPAVPTPSSPLFLTSPPPTRDSLVNETTSAMPLVEEPHEESNASETWGQTVPLPQAQSMSPVTRNGRTARRSSMGRWYPSLSSGLAGGSQQEEPVTFYQQQILTAWERERERDIASLHENIIAEAASLRASNRGGGAVVYEVATSPAAETSGGGGGGLNMWNIGVEPSLMSPSTSSLAASGGESRPLMVDPDGEIVSWGAVGPDATSWGTTPEVVNPGIDWAQMEQEAEYKPNEGLGFLER